MENDYNFEDDNLILLEYRSRAVIKKLKEVMSSK